MSQLLDYVVKLVSDDINNTISEHYYDWEIDTWSELLNAMGLDSVDMKEEVMYVLYHDELMNTVYASSFSDDGELFLENGEIVPYRKWMNLVRKNIDYSLSYNV